MKSMAIKQFSNPQDKNIDNMQKLLWKKLEMFII